MSLCESPIPIGTCVELRGLKSKPELNGHRGVVVGYVASCGRCIVVLGDVGGEAKMNVKPGNLKWK